MSRRVCFCVEGQLQHQGWRGPSPCDLNALKDVLRDARLAYGQKGDQVQFRLASGHVATVVQEGRVWVDVDAAEPTCLKRAEAMAQEAMASVLTLIRRAPYVAIPSLLTLSPLQCCRVVVTLGGFGPAMRAELLRMVSEAKAYPQGVHTVCASGGGSVFVACEWDDAWETFEVVGNSVRVRVPRVPESARGSVADGVLFAEKMVSRLRRIAAPKRMIGVRAARSI